MDIGKAFGQMFKDPQWVKKMLFFFLFGFLSMFLIGIPFTLGYSIMILHNYMQGKNELPEWEGNWENILMTGLKYGVVLIVGLVVGWIISFFTTGLISIVAGIFSETDGLEMIGMVLMLVQSAFSLVVSGALALINYMIQIRFAKNLSFSEVFDFDWYVPFFTKSWKNLLIVWLLSVVTGIIASAGLLALCIGVFVTGFYAVVTNTALLAEAARAAGEVSTSRSVTSESAPTALPTPAAPVKVEEASSEKDSEKED